MAKSLIERIWPPVGDACLVIMIVLEWVFPWLIAGLLMVLLALLVYALPVLLILVAAVAILVAAQVRGNQLDAADEARRSSKRRLSGETDGSGI